MDQNSLKGKIAVVTGAGAKRGMGHAIALRLAGEGADVVVLDKFPAPKSLFTGDEGWRGLEEEVEEIKALGREALAVTVDISDKEGTSGIIESVLAKFGRIDILVNCAAIRGTPNVDIIDGDEDEWKRMFDVNLFGSFIISKHVAKHMVQRGGGGKIILIASLAGREGVKGNAAYAASKWGVIGLVQSLAKELASHHINVNAICPGKIITNLRDHWIEAEAKKVGMISEEFRKIEYETVGKTVPIGRMGTPEDIADVVSFLVSKKADYMTGQSFNVCGGILMN
jgi:3-oxoacyl-[acyl-carrier protein] reductase/meso-butanediol dehydrogenase/(S,S)-butanediol dehydrogenase/diacetyl reductase